MMHYSSVAYDECDCEMGRLKKEVEDKLRDDYCKDDCVFCVITHYYQ